MLRVGLIGCGAIGTAIAKAIDGGLAGDVKLATIFDVDPMKAEGLKAALKTAPFVAASFGEMMGSRVDVVVEAASQRAVREYGERVLKSGKTLVVMSVGALLEDELLARMLKAAKDRNAVVCVPSGAIGGLDALKAAKLGGIKSVTLTTSKPPAALGLKVSEKKIIFEGSAEEAVKKFPQNINVAATLSLAGIGKSETKVRIVADPKLKRNVHEIEVKGKCGVFKARIENVPSPDNPKTSHIAALSAVQLIRGMTSKFWVGT